MIPAVLPQCSDIDSENFANDDARTGMSDDKRTGTQWTRRGDVSNVKIRNYKKQRLDDSAATRRRVRSNIPSGKD